jgi:hypothetical protein
VNVPLALKPARVPFADHERDRGEEKHRGQNLDKQSHPCPAV